MTLNEQRRFYRLISMAWQSIVIYRHIRPLRQDVLNSVEALVWRAEMILRGEC